MGVAISAGDQRYEQGGPEQGCLQPHARNREEQDLEEECRGCQPSEQTDGQ